MSYSLVHRRNLPTSSHRSLGSKSYSWITGSLSNVVKWTCPNHDSKIKLHTWSSNGNQKLSIEQCEVDHRKNGTHTHPPSLWTRTLLLCGALSSVTVSRFALLHLFSTSFNECLSCHLWGFALKIKTRLQMFFCNTRLTAWTHVLWNQVSALLPRYRLPA